MKQGSFSGLDSRPMAPSAVSLQRRFFSFIGRRNRWWIIPTQMRAELLLETSGLARQEQLMVKTACPEPSFEGYSEILLEHHGRIHLRDSRSLGPLAPPSRPFPAKGAGKNKGRGWYRSGYFAGDYDGQAGDEAAGEGDNYDMVKELMLGMVMSPVQKTQMIATGCQMKIVALH
jgi:hypothetical protein